MNAANQVGRRLGDFWMPACLLALLAVGAYLPTLANGFVWDDDVALTRNPLIQKPDGLYDLWCTTQPADYWPVTASTFWFEWRLWGLNPLGYHLTNVGLHAVECVLLWLILRRLRIPGAWVGALLFALHPVNAETVAWVTQRKNLMAMLFYELSLLFFLRTRPVDRGGGSPAVGSGWYAASLAAFVLAMLSKGSVAFLPLVLLGIVAWQRRLVVRDLRMAAPFFAVALALTAVNVWFQAHHLADAEVIRQATPLDRLAGAGAVVWFYLGKAVWPAGLTFFYPQWRVDAGDWRWWVPLAAAVGMTVWLLATRRKAGFFAWAYFGLALVPVMGFTDVYFMKFSLVANHYEHLALIGVTALAGAGWQTWRDRSPSRLPQAALAAVAALFFVLTWRQCLLYRDGETLLRATLRDNPDSWLAHDNLGVILGDHKQYAEARAELEKTLALNPGYAEAHSNLGVILIELGQRAAGEAQYREALRLKPDTFIVRLNLGSLLLSEGRVAEARDQLVEAARLKPNFAAAHALLGRALLRLGQGQEGVAELRRALWLDPTDRETRAELDRASLP